MRTLTYGNSSRDRKGEQQKIRRKMGEAIGVFDMAFDFKAIKREVEERRRRENLAIACNNVWDSSEINGF